MLSSNQMKTIKSLNPQMQYQKIKIFKTIIRDRSKASFLAPILCLTHIQHQKINGVRPTPK